MGSIAFSSLFTFFSLSQQARRPYLGFLILSSSSTSRRQGMDARHNAYYTSLLQGGAILEDQLLMEPEDEIEFTYPNQHDQVFTQASQTSGQMGSASKKLQRGPKFTIEEDRLLVSAYLNISLDAVRGTNQKQTTYWKRVWDYFQENKAKSFDSERTENSLMNRWSTIQISVNKFCGCLAQIELKNQSGMTEEGKVIDAKDLYKALHKGQFQSEHCWILLKYQPKWLEDLERKKPQRNKTWTVPSPSTPDVIDVGEGDATFVDLERPPGTKAEKERRRKRNAEQVPSPLAGILTDIKEEQKKVSDKKMDIIQQLNVREQERLQLDKERVRQEQEKIAIKQEMLRVKQLKEDERIMLVDTSGLPPGQQEYYQSRQKEILQQREKMI